MTGALLEPAPDARRRERLISSDFRRPEAPCDSGSQNSPHYNIICPIEKSIDQINSLPFFGEDSVVSRLPRRRAAVADPDLAVVLRQLPPFASPDGAVLNRLALEAKISIFQEGDALYRQGDPGRFLFILFVRRVKVLRQGATGTDLICDLHRAPSLMGEFAAYTGASHLMTAVALEVCQVALLDRQSLRSTMEFHPELADRFLERFQDRYAHLSTQIDILTAGSVDNRLACLLMRLRASERDVGLRRVIPLALTRHELAELLDTTTETIVRVLTRWKDRGVIATTKQEIEVRQWGPVERLALGEGKAIDSVLRDR